MVRKSKGRQKIEMVKMENQSNLRVTFSKRRLSLFKMASELCTLCDVEVGIVVFSPSHKVFSFGHPNLEALINRVMGNPSENSNITQILQTHPNSTVGQLNFQLTQLMSAIEVEKLNEEMLDKIIETRQNIFWWEKPIDQLNLDDLKRLKDALEGLKKKVMNEAQRVMMVQSSN